MKRIAWMVTCLSLLIGLGAARSARADDTPAEALNQRLDALDEEERALLAPMLERGPVALVELVKDETLPAVLVATYVDAPAAAVANIISNPKEYPKFMKTLDHVEVLSQNQTQTAYKWTWQTGVLFLEGENRMTSFPPPAGHPELGHRISVKSERGQLGEGRLLWRVFPAGEKRSLLMLAMRVDMREANFVMKQLEAAAKSVNRSVNLALCYVMVLGTKREAERREGRAPTTLAKSVFEAPSYDLNKLKKLMARADLLMMELTPSGLGKLTILGRTGMTPAAIRPVMTEPETFGKALVPGSYTRVTKREGTQKTFEWGISLPLIGTSGVMLMNDQGQTLSIDAVDGALKGGKWRFETPTLPGGEAVVLGYSTFDITKTTWLIEKIAAMDPAMGHGLAAASQVMMLRALRKRAHDVAKEAKPTPAAAPAPVPAGHPTHAASAVPVAPAAASAPAPTTAQAPAVAPVHAAPAAAAAPAAPSPPAPSAPSVQPPSASAPPAKAAAK
ncbi:MAG: SRPBCC family protein [Myxococcales bacterium]